MISFIMVRDRGFAAPVAYQFLGILSVMPGKIEESNNHITISAHTKIWLDPCHIVQYWDLSVKQNLGVTVRPEQ